MGSPGRFPLIGLWLALVGLLFVTSHAWAVQPPTPPRQETTQRAVTPAPTTARGAAATRRAPRQEERDATNGAHVPASHPARDKPIALGLVSTDDDWKLMERFSKTVGAKAYNHVYGSWDDHLAPEEIRQKEEQMMWASSTIHFNLSEMNWGKFLAWARTPEAERDVAHTHHELLFLIRHPELRAKTVFYLYGKKTNPCTENLGAGGAPSFVKAMTQMRTALCGGI
jgi:hypothetical protein